MAFYKVDNVRELETATYSYTVVGVGVKAGQDCGIEGEASDSKTNSRTFPTRQTPDGREGFLQSISITCSARKMNGSALGRFWLNGDGGVGQIGYGQAAGEHEDVTNTRYFSYNIDIKSSQMYQNATNFSLSGLAEASTTNWAVGYCTSSEASVTVSATYLVYKDSHATP